MAASLFLALSPAALRFRDFYLHFLINAVPKKDRKQEKNEDGGNISNDKRNATM